MAHDGKFVINQSLSCDFPKAIDLFGQRRADVGDGWMLGAQVVQYAGGDDIPASGHGPSQSPLIRALCLPPRFLTGAGQHVRQRRGNLKEQRVRLARFPPLAHGFNVHHAGMSAPSVPAQDHRAAFTDPAAQCAYRDAKVVRSFG